MRLGGFGFDSPGKDGTPGRSSSKNAPGGASSQHFSPNEYGYARLPPPAFNEIEFFIESPLTKKSREASRSERKTVGSFTFDILVFVSGNQTTFTTNPKVAVYVECGDAEGKDERWVYNSVKFSVCIVNFKDVRKSLYHEDSHSFCAAAVDRGWPELLSDAEITQENGWLDEQGRLCIRAAVCNRQADTIFMSGDYDTRKETGFIGLKNHGATCYLNGLLQSYFHLGKFREIVYAMRDDQIHKSGSESPSGTRMSLPLALQSVFLRLETSDHAVNTIELTRSFGWDSMDAFTQHDVQELARILCDKLEERLKGTPGDRAIQDLFEGKVDNFIECIDVDYKSTKPESFYDVPVNVRGFTGEPLISLENALKEFTAVETMEGDNAYDAEKFGKQRARKGIRFTKFPRVLSFQLKRFSFDYERMDNVKLHDRFEFGTTLDCNQFLPGAGEYVLHTVLVHSGDVHSGHYYAFVRPEVDSDQWFRFDDEQVSKCSEFAAVDDNFGGEDVYPVNLFANGGKAKPVTRPRIHSAYMLLYVKKSEWKSLMTKPSIQEVQDRVLTESRKLDERKRIHEEQKQIVTLLVSTEADLVKSQGLNRIGPAKHSVEMKAKKDAKVTEIAGDIAKILNKRDGKHTALFYLYSSNPKNPPRWCLMSPTYISASVTPKSSRLLESISPLTRGLSGLVGIHKFSEPALVDGGDRCLRDFPVTEDAGGKNSTLSVLAVTSETDQLQNWTDGSSFVLVVVKHFNVVSKNLSVVGVKYAHTDDRIATLIPWLAGRVGGNASTESADYLAFEEESGSSMRQLEILGSFGAERVVTGSTIVFQSNTITEAETEESSEDDEATVPSLLPPTFTARTVADFAQAKCSSVACTVEMHAIDERACTDGIVADGSHIDDLVEEAAMETKDGSIAFRADIRWSLRVMAAEVIKKCKLQNIDMDRNRIEVYEQPPSLNKEGPIATSDNLTSTSRVGKVATCKHLVPVEDEFAFKWDLHVVAVPRDSVMVRLFDSAVVERKAMMVNIKAELPNHGRRVTVAQFVAVTGLAAPDKKYRILDMHKAQIERIYRQDDVLNFEEILSNITNPTFEYIRVEPDDDIPRDFIEQHVSHVDRNSGIHFGYPFVVMAEAGATAKTVKSRIQQKLGVTDKRISRWRLCAESHGKLIHLKDDDQVSGSRIALEHNHPNPELLGVHRSTAHAHKPLTIR